MTAPTAPPATGRPTVAEVGPEAAAEVVEIVHAAFGSRPPLDPPSTALEETVGSVSDALHAGGGLLASLDGRPVGALIFEPEGESLLLRRVSVRPEAQRRGVAQALSDTADAVARRRGFTGLHVTARTELPGTVRFWTRSGYRQTSSTGTTVTLGKAVPLVCEVPTAESMRELGRRLAGHLRAGDLLILTGDLGAGKTTFTQGLGAGLQVRGDITSPTFVISRVHPSLRGGPALVHADAYRLGSAAGTEAVAELDDLDLDLSVGQSVTVVEWGEGLAEGLAEDRLEITIRRPAGGDVSAGDDEHRMVRIKPVGVRWVGSGLAEVVA